MSKMSRKNCEKPTKSPPLYLLFIVNWKWMSEKVTLNWCVVYKRVLSMQPKDLINKESDYSLMMIVLIHNIIFQHSTYPIMMPSTTNKRNTISYYCICAFHWYSIVKSEMWNFSFIDIPYVYWSMNKWKVKLWIKICSEF